MKKILRITESELNNIVERSARRLVMEHLDTNKRIMLAHTELDEIKTSIHAIGQWLYGTPYYNQYKSMLYAMRKLYSDLLNSMYTKGDNK